MDEQEKKQGARQRRTRHRAADRGRRTLRPALPPLHRCNRAAGRKRVLIVIISPVPLLPLWRTAAKLHLPENCWTSCERSRLTENQGITFGGSAPSRSTARSVLPNVQTTPGSLTGERLPARPGHIRSTTRRNVVMMLDDREMGRQDCTPARLRAPLAQCQRCARGRRRRNGQRRDIWQGVSVCFAFSDHLLVSRCTLSRAPPQPTGEFSAPCDDEGAWRD